MNNQLSETSDKARDRKVFTYIIIAALVCLVGIYSLNVYQSMEIGNDEYNLILSLAINCERDDCDRITDALSDGFIDLRESTAILLLENVGEVTTDDNPKASLISLVSSDDRFRPIER